MTPATKSSPLLELLSPDGYYTYLGIQKPPIILAISSSDDEKNNANKIDEELVKKNYRKLSLRHHPDKPGGDADTFRLLNRAQRVLLNEKLRQQYDVLGIDLDDDEADNNTSQSNHNIDVNASHDERPSTAQGIVHEIAATILSGIIQLGVRTCKLFLYFEYRYLKIIF
jgi:DnaJ domain